MDKYKIYRSAGGIHKLTGSGIKAHLSLFLSDARSKCQAMIYCCCIKLEWRQSRPRSGNCTTASDPATTKHRLPLQATLCRATSAKCSSQAFVNVISNTPARPTVYVACGKCLWSGHRKIFWLKGCVFIKTLWTSICLGLCRVHCSCVWRSPTEKHLLHGRSQHHHHQQQRRGQEDSPGECVQMKTWSQRLDIQSYSILSALYPNGAVVQSHLPKSNPRVS